MKRIDPYAIVAFVVALFVLGAVINVLVALSVYIWRHVL